MVTIITWMFVLYFIYKIFPTNTVTSNQSIEQDVEDFMVMDLVSDGELDGDWE